MVGVSGFTVMFSSLLLKNYRIYRLFAMTDLTAVIIQDHQLTLVMMFDLGIVLSFCDLIEL